MLLIFGSMSGETDLSILLRTLKPILNPGDYAFCVVKDLSPEYVRNAIMTFKEGEGTTLILKKELADQLGLTYTFVAAWITLTVHSSLEAVGMTASFSAALTKEGISCNVVAAFHHDHVFVAKDDAKKAIQVLNGLAGNGDR